MLKKFCAMLLALMLLCGMLAGCAASSDVADDPAASGTSKEDGQKLKVAFVISASISDGSFGTISYQGIQAVEEEPYIEKVDFVESVTAATDAAKAIRDYIADGYDVIWTQGGQFTSVVMEIAPEFPDTVFVAVGAPSDDKTFDNVWFSSTEHEGAYYLSGVVAAHTTKSNTIGFVGGREHPLYAACAKAYEEGAQSVNPDIKALSVFSGDYNDPIKAKEATVSQIQSGADVIVHLQDLGMSGVFAAAEEATQGGNQVWIIGKGSDQYDQAPDVILTSVVYDYGVQMKNILSEIANGVKGGIMLQHLNNGSIYLADFHDCVSPEVAAEVEALTEKVIAGEIKYTTQYDIK